MAIILPSGFNITNNEPVDARFSLADQTARYGLSSANIYEGLVVYQRDNNTLWILVDTAQVSNSSGWQQITSSELSDTITDRLDSLELTSASHDSRLDSLEGFTSSIDTTIKTKLNVEGVLSGSSQVLGGSGLLSSSATNFTDFSQSVDNRLDLLESNSSSLQNIYEEKASGTHTLVSGSSQLTSSYDSRYVTLDGDQTINGTKTFNDIIVNGTGSFAYITSISGTAKIIGDAFIVLNTDTPTSRYAGLSVYDSGSTLSTASFYYDGETNDWGYEYSSSAGIDYAVTIFGPEYTTKGTPTYLTSNRIPKAVDNHHLNDSNISDSGTLITLNSNSQVNGNLVVNGTVSANNLVSGSAQITKTLQEVTSAGNTTSTSISITNSTASTSKTTGALIVTGGIGTSGDIFAGGDVVAYASSDRRLKDNIELISNPLQKINKIGGYSFEWNEEKQNIYKGKDYGVIAQEIEEILPELVENRDNGYKAVKYDKLVSLLIEGIKDLSKQVEELNEKINRG